MLLELAWVGVKGDWGTYGHDEDCLEQGADEDEYTGAKHDGGANLLDEFQFRSP